MPRKGFRATDSLLGHDVSPAYRADAAAPLPSRVALAETVVPLPRQGGTSPILLAALVRLLDALLVSVSGGIIAWFYLPIHIRESATAYWIAMPLIGIGAVGLFEILQLYTIQAFRRPIRSGLRLASGFGAVFLLMFATLFFLKMEGVFSRFVFASWYVLGFVLLMVSRLLLSLFVSNLTRLGHLDRRVAIVGGGDLAATLLQSFTSDPDSDVKICGLFDDRINEERSPDLLAGHPKLGTVADLVAYARKAPLDLIIFALPVTAETRILAMLRQLWVLPIDIRLAAHAQKLRFRPRNYSFIGSVPLFDLADRPVSVWGRAFKSAFDRILAILLILLLSPVLLMVALAVKLTSRGPVLFRQKRYGFNNELIEIFKFRSMYVEQTDAGASKLVTKNDPRVTPVGRFIRKTSLDELPQLLNVALHGSLSLVGPRPHALQAKAENRRYDEVVDGYFARHKVKPGITGWAQINGWRGETDTEEKLQKRVEHDLFYIENWSPLFDLYILVMTPFALLRTENAY